MPSWRKTGSNNWLTCFGGGGDFPEPRQICIQVGTLPYLRELAPLSPRFTLKKCWIRGGHDVYDDNDISSLEKSKKKSKTHPFF